MAITAAVLFVLFLVTVVTIVVIAVKGAKYVKSNSFSTPKFFKWVAIELILAVVATLFLVFAVVFGGFALVELLFSWLTLWISSL